MSKIINVNNKAMILCFVCDQKVTGEKVNLASSISTHSKVTLPEKISQLIGDDYVVAVTEQDCVCKRCASLLNHMDKLENELTLVKRALMTNIAQKYKISLDGQTPPVNPTPSPATPQQQTLANGLKTDSASDYEDEGRKNSADILTNTASLLKKKPPPPTKVVTTPKPANKPAENVTKLKIYKCGFCSYQSKELSNVRLHMKIHIRANKPDGDGDKGPVASTPLMTPKTPVSVRRRVFRCQVCSASFDDRNKCLEHISRDHTAAGRKTMEQKQTQEGKQHTLLSAKKDGTVNELDDQSSTMHTEQSEKENLEAQQKESFDDVGSQEEMDTSEPPSIALYSCDTCSATFNNDVDFANHVNEHVKNEVANTETKTVGIDGDGGKAEDSDFTRVDSQAETQPVDDETPKEPTIGLDIEAMIAALHSEGPDTTPDSMPNI